MTGIERLVDIVNDGPYSGGMIHISVQKLREICEQIEREQDAAVNDSPCDAILTEDREAISWVRAYGGLEKVKQDALCWNTAENIAQTTLDWLARVCPVAGIEKCGYGVSLEKLEDAINRRLMPDGMEWLLEVWPKWSNGEYCKFGDWWTAKRYGDYEPKKLLRLVIYTPEQLSEWEQGDGESYGYEWDFMRPSEVGYRPDKADQPSPPVLAADGKPLEVGQTVWRIDTGAEYWVKSGQTITADAVVIIRKTDCDCESEIVKASQLTHQRPVLDANGVPINKGDTVWLVDQSDSDWKFTVANVLAPNEHSDGKWSVKIKSDWGVFTYREPSQITHAKSEPPDSWEKVEKDADLKPRGYVDLVLGWDMSKNHSENQARWAMTHDLVRRCRALAERKRGE